MINIDKLKKYSNILTFIGATSAITALLLCFQRLIPLSNSSYLREHIPAITTLTITLFITSLIT
ncbi:MAG: hypothetical protein RSA01_10455, partial [Clostridium sp.]